MGSIILAAVPLAALTVGYLFYSPRIAKWIGLDPSEKTPAVEMNDGVDYVPARHWTILFGHHFASIAGAAPIIGPVIACLYWGWLPALVWIVAGGILFGAVHDFTALTLSAKHKGVSIASITESVLGRSARVVFSLFVLLAMILVVAVFAAVAGKTLATTPKVVIPTFGLVLVAMLVGTMMYRLKWNTAACSIAGLVLLAGLIWAGYHFPLSLAPCRVGEVIQLEGNASALGEGGEERELAVDSPVYGNDVIQTGAGSSISVRYEEGDRESAADGEEITVGRNVYELANIEHPDKWWIVILLVYGLLASVTPVTVLLQPRDHLAAGVLFIGMALGFGGLILTHPSVNAPPFVKFDTAQGWLWPMLFVVIACGAISGFHSLVASGTTSKQLARMGDARRIGYGGMIMECALAVLAVVAVTAGLYWLKVPAGADGEVYQEVFKRGGWIKAFGRGYGTITRNLLFGYGTLVGITMLKTFVMTTLDTATRITRYVCTELLGESFRIKPLRNKYLATLLVGIAAGALALGNWRAIWPIFGSANQLIASLVLIVTSVYLLTHGRRSVFTAVPGFIMLVTTMAALVYQAHGFITSEEPKVMLASVSIVLMILALFIFGRSVVVFVAAGKKAGERTTAT
ncbi:MAG: carbon starvation CstA family protein [Kiritimatiellia bacterium]